MKNFIKLSLCALILFTATSNVWGWTINGTIYYDDTKSNWLSNDNSIVQVFGQKGGTFGSQGFMMTHISHTKLYVKESWSWGDGDVQNVRFACTKGDAVWGWSTTGSWERLNNNDNTIGISGPWGDDITSYTLAVSSGPGSKTSAANLESWSKNSDYKNLLNKPQTVHYMLWNGSAYAEQYAQASSNWPVTVTPTRYSMSSANTASMYNTSFSNNKYQFTSVITSQASIALSNIADGYKFMGWSIDDSGNGPDNTDATYNYTVSNTHNIYIYFNYDPCPSCKYIEK